MVSMVVAVDKNWGIGNKGDLLIKIPQDIKFFKNLTTDNVVIMGRKTLESLPNKLPLKDRVNIVITSDKDYKVNDVIVVHSIEEALEEAKKYEGKEIYNIGGGSIFNQMIDYCDAAYVTFIDYAYEADTYCPRIDKMPEWVLENEGEEQTYLDIAYNFRKYVKK